MTEWLGLPTDLAILAICACFLAGAIRGFAGFGLSALAMAMLGSFIPPVELLPVFWFLEMAASLILMKGGWADADRPTALMLMGFAAVALPFGLWFSLTADPVLSKTVALSILVVLGVAQLRRVKIPFLATRPGTALAGAGAGIVAGLSGAGGMFIALYALVRDLPARTMRGTLNIYILGGGVLGLASHLLVGTMTTQSAARAAVLILPTLLGVALGRALFTPRYERFYKPVSLTLLIGLAAFGLARLALS